MQGILPLAGLGTRMRPLTWSRPKPLLYLAGQTVLDHVLDRLAAVPIEEWILIVGYLGEQIRAHIRSHYTIEAHFVEQRELKGQAHALYLAKHLMHGPCLIVFADTLFEADLSGLDEEDADIVLFTKEVQDPRRFGVAIEEGGQVVRIREKPETMEHRQAVVGIYYIRQGEALIAAIEHLLAQDMRTKGEYYLADALQLMIDRGARAIARRVAVWEDCGTPETLLQTHRYLLDHGFTRELGVTNSVLIPPVYIADGAQIVDSVIGPYVTVGPGARLKRVVARDSILDAGCQVADLLLANSLIGREAKVQVAHQDARK